MIEEANAFEKIMKRKHDIPKPEYHEIALEQAIEHLKESLSDSQHEWHCDECKHEHEQLLDWLKELEKNRQVIRVLLPKFEKEVKTNKYYQKRCNSLEQSFTELTEINYKLIQQNKELLEASRKLAVVFDFINKKTENKE